MKLISRFLIILLIFLSIIDARGRMGWTSGTDTSYTTRAVGNPFTCSIDSFVFVSEDKDYPTDGYGLDLINETSLVGAENFYPKNINAVGYNIKDNYIWGYDRVNQKVVRIDDNYYVDSYTIAGLPAYGAPTYGYHIGDVSPDGILYLMTRDDAANIYRVDVNPSSSTYLTMLPTINLSKTDLDTADFAFHPSNNMIYLPNKTDGKLYQINPSDGNVTDMGTLGVVGYATSNVTFFDRDNNFYFNNSTDDWIYKIDLTNPSTHTGASTYVEFEIPSQGDGARCVNAPMVETPVLSIDDVSVIEGNSGVKSITFTITSDINISAIGGVDVNYTLVDGSATVGSDYIASSGTINISRGDNSVLLTLPIINGDSDIEPDETFFVRLSSTKAIFSDDEAIGTIINNDFDIRLNAKTSGGASFDGNITTQIVNQSFDLNISAYNFTTSSAVKDMNITGLQIFQKDGPVISTWAGSRLTDASGLVPFVVSVNKAVKITGVKIYGNYMDTNYSNDASDYFAVRPDSFTLSVPIMSKASEAFEINASVVDISNSLVTTYNESIDTSFKIDYSEKLATCDKGMIDLSGLRFVNGKMSDDINYSEIGEVDFNISEIAGSEFAKIDENDTADAQRYITKAGATSKFSVGKFNIGSWSLNNGANDFTYYADEDDIHAMGAELNISVEAVNLAGDVVKNYRSGCYVKDTNLSLKYDVVLTTPQTNRLITQDMRDSNSSAIFVREFSNTLLDESFDFSILSSRFIDGESNESIHINFDRDKSEAKEPLRFNMSDVNVTGDGASGSSAIVASVDFYYGRVHVPDYSNATDKPKVVVFYEIYCDDCNKLDFIYADGRESVDTIHWYMLNKLQYNDGISLFSDLNSVNSDTFDSQPDEDTFTSGSAYVAKTNNLDLIEFKIPKLPFSDRLIYKPKSWMIYNRFNNMADKHSFNMNLTTKADTWAGRGEIGLSVEDDASKKDLKKIEW